jgi:hypothetical protein
MSLLCRLLKNLIVFNNMVDRQHPGQPKSAPIRVDSSVQSIIPQRQLQYLQELGKEFGSKPQDMPTEFKEASTTGYEESQAESNLGRYRKKHEIENHYGLFPNGSHILGGALQRDEAEILKRKKELQRKEMLEALQKQIDEKTLLKQQSEHQSLQAKTAVRAQQTTLGSEPVAQPSMPKSSKLNEPKSKELKTPNSSDPVLLFDLNSAQQAETTSDMKQPEALPKDNEALDYLSQLCQKLIEEQEQLKSKVIDQDSVIEKLKRSRVESAPTSAKRQPLPPRTAHKLKQKEELARISEIEQKIQAARMRADTRRAAKTKSGARATQSQLDRPAPRRTSATKHTRLTAQPLRIQSAVAKLTGEVELPPLLSALSEEFFHDEVKGSSRFFYPDSEGQFSFDFDN